MVTEQMLQPASIVRYQNHNSHSHNHKANWLLQWNLKSPSIDFRFRRLLHNSSRTRRSSSFSPLVFSSSSPVAVRSSSSLTHPSLRYAVLGAGFAGLSVAYHLLQQTSTNSRICIDIYDEVGIGGGASGVSGGLLHPYSPKGSHQLCRMWASLIVLVQVLAAKLLWRGAECWKESLDLLSIAEAAVASRKSIFESGEIDQKSDGFMVRRRGILRPAMNMKNFDVLSNNAHNCLASCRIVSIDKDAVKNLVPNLLVPFNSAFYMPEAVNIHPQRYLEALFLACESLVKVGCGGKELYLRKKSINTLSDLAGEYDAVIICLGAKADMILELSGRLPLRTCRGVIAQMQLPDNKGEDYPGHGPSILSDAWLAVQGPRRLYMGATWEWKSRNYSPIVSTDEASKALQELLPKASTVYPDIKDWTLTGARAGLRAMPPLTPNGSLPLLGCVDNFVGENHNCKYWLFGGLGSRGLLYHGWLGKLMAQAVLYCNEDLIPSELLSWKTIKQ